MAKREKRPVGSTPTTPKKVLTPSEEAAAKRAARRENRTTTGVPSTRASVPPRQTVAQANRKKREILTQEQIAYQLAHPTKTVSYEELQRDYTHVVRDIRNMFILALILMVSMVILAQVL